MDIAPGRGAFSIGLLMVQETITNPLLTERQRREREFYDQFAKSAPDTVCFGPIEGGERRPWNAHWTVHEAVLARFTSPSQRILDFGCGPGLASVAYAKMGYDVFGFDLSPSNVAHATQLARKYGVSHRTHFTVQTAESLTYPAEWFDVIAGLDILHHVDISRAVAQCMRVLKPGGVALFAEPLEVPPFDTIRNTGLVRWLVPNHKSFDRHITCDERKLTAADLETIRQHSSHVSLRRFLVLSRLDRFIRPTERKTPSALERLDYYLFRLFPPLEALGGYGVLTLTKD